MTTLWEFLDVYQIKVARPTTFFFRFDGDCFLMSMTSVFYVRDLRIFNFCRIYLKVELLSDILTACGSKVRESVWLGAFSEIGKKQCQWPNQPRPSKRCWKIWRLSLSGILGANEQGTLLVPHLGNCGSPDWQWIYSPSEQRLYENRRLGGYYSISNEGRWPRRQPYLQFSRLSFVDSDNVDIPSDSINVTIIGKHDTIVIDGIGGKTGGQQGFLPK
jgi:hypothetical protein